MKRKMIMRIIGSEQEIITKDLSNSKNDAVLINSISYSREKDEHGTPILRLTIDKDWEHSTASIFDAIKNDEKIDITIKYFIEGEEPSIINYSNVIIDRIKSLFCADGFNFDDNLAIRQGKLYELIQVISYN
ncbi:hypothetical protein [Providencia rettgeri]|uniref:hypothetical protein n=1 Tax=Providencia TaxID=586 RepID=UPI001BD441E3|nr:hypothetical protein [Providencia rettgeri]ELR5068970.1 hypothetical protein [Providencia rettgeri]ELR5075350.1 hypothetical protein [Providencia stuartii]ELR5222817.1 hypothetical protein [Providencia rettgeri]MDX7322878.1 hypothetical protein [Providencia rettgeri]